MSVYIISQHMKTYILLCRPCRKLNSRNNFNAKFLTRSYTLCNSAHAVMVCYGYAFVTQILKSGYNLRRRQTAVRIVCMNMVIHFFLSVKNHIIKSSFLISSAAASPLTVLIISRANSIAVPGPCDVIIFPSV